jgi:hypothetical protein
MTAEDWIILRLLRMSALSNRAVATKTEFMCSLIYMHRKLGGTALLEAIDALTAEEESK